MGLFAAPAAMLALALTLAIGVPALVAAVVIPCARLGHRLAGLVALAAPTAVVAGGVWLAAEVAHRGELQRSVAALPALGIAFSLRVDRLAILFVLLIGVIGLAVFQYSRHYLGKKATGGYWALLSGFTAAMVGLVVADNLILMFVFWELTTVTSALLIGGQMEDPEARRGAVQAFLVTGLGGLAMLAGALLLGLIAGTSDLSALAGRSEAIVADPRHIPPLVLLLVGAFTKSAQFPFHFWLPGAMAAPTPVSAYLHSATMVKAGIFLIARLFPVFAASPVWLPITGTVGLATFLVAGWGAIRSVDVKRLLAFSTASHLGFLTAFYAYASRAGLVGESLQIASHAFYKSALFLLIGWLEKRTGTRSLLVLGREHWFLHAPTGALLFAVGTASLAGLPLVLGFAGKELFYEALLHRPSAWTLPAAAVALSGSVLAVAYALRLVVTAFFGPERPSDERLAVRPSPWLLWLPGLLLVPQIAGGLAPGWFVRTFLDPATPWPAGPAIWHHVDLLLGASLTALTGGLVLFLLWRPPAIRDAATWLERGAAAVARAALAVAATVGRWAQAGGHPRYALVLLVVAAAAMVGTFVGRGALGQGVRLDWGPDTRLGWIVAPTIVAGALGALATPNRVSKTILLGVVGYGLAVLYLLFRAPDLALTQILVESVSLVVVLLAYRRLPRLGPDQRTRRQAFAHGGVAVLLGTLMTAFAWWVGQTPPANRAGADQLARSLPEAHGRNVVNVILVDFRGADTLGEITVLVIAALGASALLRARRPGRPGPEERP